MIVDKILDRKDGTPYSPHDFYIDCLKYGRVGDYLECGRASVEITRAMAYGTEEDVKRALCKYVVDNEYNPLLCDYINRINWLSETNPAIEEAAALTFNSACKAREVESELDKKLENAIERSSLNNSKNEIIKEDFIKE